MPDLKVRRVVTGHDERGRAICVADGPAPRLISNPRRPGVAGADLWRTHEAPASLEAADRTMEGPTSLVPPVGGTVFRIIEFLPEHAHSSEGIDAAEAFAAMGARENLVENARHPFMHRTETIDYAVILSGEITMLLDEDDIVLRAGDTVVQRGTNHSWANRGSEPCRVGFVLVDAISE